ncbi:MAG: right-handed parallel beta-helix repeat-containing protein [Anaerorhabdus sp.]
MIKINAKDYGIIPNSDKDQTKKIVKLLNDVKNIDEACSVKFDYGTYNFYRENSLNYKCFISNCTTSKEYADNTRHFGIVIENQKNLTIDASGSKFNYIDKMSEVLIKDSTNIKLINCKFDFKEPTVFEFKVIKKGLFYIDVKINEEYQEIFTTRLWKKMKLCVKISNSTKKFKRVFSINKLFIKQKHLGNNTYRLYSLGLINLFNINVNDVFHFRDGIRNEVGIFIENSKNITLEYCNLNFMHGLGIIAQKCKNLNFKSLNFIPQVGRTCAGFADFLHISGCKGNVFIKNCKFDGAHDDCINIHSTYLKVLKKISDYELEVRYMHPQTYGIMPFIVDDEIMLVNSSTLMSYHKNSVVDCVRVDNYVFKVKLANKINKVEKSSVIQNLSEVTEVVIEDNYFTNTPTRGILLTNGKKAVIRNNKFIRVNMSAILIACDANSWYESGPVNDVLIENNYFEDCGFPNINIAPEVKKIDGYIHKNIKIDSNEFNINNLKPIISANHVDGLKIVNNKCNLPILKKIKNCINIIEEDIKC